MRTFNLERDIDITGISGTGRVAEGVEFTDGTVVLRWGGDTPSTVIHASIKNVERIHCHAGASRIVWLDDSSDGSVRKIYGAAQRYRKDAK